VARRVAVETPDEETQLLCRFRQRLGVEDERLVRVLATATPATWRLGGIRRCRGALAFFPRCEDTDGRRYPVWVV
jgi:hypothetical protein